MADRYWVGGTASWDATAGTKWATTSGGAGGAAVPTSADNVFFDAASGAVIVTGSGTLNCADISFAGFTGTFAGNANFNIYGSFLLSSGMTYTSTSALQFRATASGKTITTNGKTLYSVLFVGTGGEWTLQDNLTVTTSLSVNIGTFNTNNFAINLGGNFNSNTATTRSVSLGSSVISLTGTNTWDLSTTTNLTFNAGTSTIKKTNSNSSFIFQGGGLTYYNLELNGGIPSAGISSSSGIVSIYGTNTFNNLVIQPSSTLLASVTLYASQTITGTFTVVGTTQYRAFIFSSTRGTSRTITAAAVSIQDADFMDITGAGAAAPWALSSQRVGDCGGNSGITFPSPVNRYAVAAGNYYSTSMWSATSGGASGASVPLPQDTAYFNASSPAGTYTMNMYTYGAIDCTGFTRTLAIANNILIYGSITLNSTMTYTNSSQLNFVSRTTVSINFANKSNSQIWFEGIGATYNLASALTASDVLIQNDSVFNTNNYAVTVQSIYGNNTSSINLGSSSVTCTLPIGAPLTILSTASFNAGTSTITCNSTSSFDRNLSATNRTFYNFVIGSSTGGGSFTLGSGNTFNTISTTKTVAHTIKFTAGTTTTVTNFTVTGTAGGVVTLTSTSTSQATLAKAGGGTVTVDYANISYLNGTPSSTWYATNSTDGGNNTGWTITAPPPFSGNSLLFGSNF